MLPSKNTLLTKSPVLASTDVKRTNFKLVPILSSGKTAEMEDSTKHTPKTSTKQAFHPSIICASAGLRFSKRIADTLGRH